MWISKALDVIIEPKIRVEVSSKMIVNDIGYVDLLKPKMFPDINIQPFKNTDKLSMKEI